MNILIVNGSPRTNSNTKKLAEYLTYVLKSKQLSIQTCLVNLDELNLPFYRCEEKDYEDENVQMFLNSCQEADGLIICTPEYHAAISGCLKSALDFVSSKHVQGKPAAIFSVAGGGKGGINALNNLRTILRSLYVNVIPAQLVIDSFLFDEKNFIGNENYEKAIVRIINDLVDNINYSVLQR
ncbi:FMN-dependent NADH-azoreductase [Bacillus wiedmannii]|uniref:NADPH-dependent FMN reductase n=1 Tax=Bacillus wiedmannii TaxID=1890302 RepID=UPI000BF59530|nr:NADPH-dependent FMN reductase [Bacillus wiedmannii]PEP92444.1 FMN-dependent NADH-azoreductase [Bacillus wiedmannii]